MNYMKPLILWLVILVLLATGLHSSQGEETQAVFDGLAWPEIKNPQKLIDATKAATEHVKAGGKQWSDAVFFEKAGIAYFHPSFCMIESGYVVIFLDTHPYTGQAIVVTLYPETMKSGNGGGYWMVDTSIPEIKLMLSKLPTSAPIGMSSEADVTVSVGWRKIRNLDGDKNTWPKALEMSFPSYPGKLVTKGLMGEALVEFTVTEQGSVEALKVKATLPEFETAVREVAATWRFEPGITRDTRHPVATRMSLTVIFDYKD